MTDHPLHTILFNDDRYQRCNIMLGQRLFRHDHVSEGRLVGTLSGVVVDGLMDCGHSAPFGGVDLVKPREQLGIIIGLLRNALAHARAEAVRDIRIRARPGYFGENEPAVEFALLNLGASIESCELSLGLQIWRYRTPEDYLASLSDSARNMVRQGLRTGMAFDATVSTTEWPACFELLAEAKRRRGVALKFSLDYIKQLHKLFGSRIAMHRLLYRGELAGAALVYRIEPHWDYVAAWGDELRHRSKRVMNLMVYHLVCAAVAQQVKVLDLGISSVAGSADDRLIQFKRSVGAVVGLRTNFRMPVA